MGYLYLFTGSERFHRTCCALTTNVVYIDRWHVPVYIEICRSPVNGSGPTRNTWFLGPIRVHNPNGISIGLTVSAQLTKVQHRQTDRLTRLRYICSHKPHLMLRMRCGLIISSTSSDVASRGTARRAMQLTSCRIDRALRGSSTIVFEKVVTLMPSKVKSTPYEM